MSRQVLTPLAFRRHVDPFDEWRLIDGCLVVEGLTVAVGFYTSAVALQPG